MVAIMAKKYEINAEQLNELQVARKENRDKAVDRRIHALIIRRGNKRERYFSGHRVKDNIFMKSTKILCKRI